MRVALSNDQFAEELRTFTSSAFRLEQQPAYWVAAERGPFRAFLSGNHLDLREMAAFKQWYQQVRDLTAAGKRMERVRIHDDPPTDYQRWVRAGGQWNTDAGEVIHYLTRREAHNVGLLPAAGDDDWWLFDDTRLMVMKYDGTGRRIHTELITDGEALMHARSLRDLAVRTTRGENR